MQFSLVKGQNSVIERLTSMVDKHRMPHALLLSGKDGYGSMAIGLALAQYISCTGDKSHGDSCGQCPSCRKYQKLEHPDLHFIFPTVTTSSVKTNPSSSLFVAKFRDFVLKTKGYGDVSQWLSFIGGDGKQGVINVRDAEEILSTLNIKAFESQYKIVLIWNADRLNIQASNKLLKILEEPYSNTIFILTAERKEKILPTILSRVQQINLGRLSDDILLQEILKQNPALSPEEAKRNAMLCQGDITKATDENAAIEQEYRDLFIQMNRLAMMYKKQAAEIIKFTDEISKFTREHLKGFIYFYTKTIENCWLYTSGLNMIQHPLETMDEKFKQNFPKFITPNNIENIFSLMEKTQHNIDSNANAKINIFNTIIRLGMLLEQR